ncbi:hypothetical protein L6164_036567 [Bauhinia variegata]|uniref:Uncharacterized protein n=1 Tax=Bauhinia variegata TaxID=167791 RepID=A0ACB9KHK4_BAUVA|nr:hypothetical protein L6164_036567 [Bauhinia variegata]
MQFSIEDGLVPQEGFKPWTTAIEDRNFIMGPTCCDRRDCEVIMMVGLPASGKTTWAEKWVKEHPEKRYVLLGTNLILDQMKVPGLLRKNNYGERFDHLMDRATGIFNILISRAANTPRNYIIDQTNVYKSARKRKLKPFAGFQKIAVVTFPKPEELKRRSEKRFKEMGKEIPPDAVNAMLANFVLPKSKNMPGSDEFFDEVMYVELNRDESCKYLEQMKQDLASLSNNNSSMLPHGGCYRSLAGPPLQNQGSSLTGSGSHWQGSYSPIPPCNYRIPIQVNAASRETGLQGSLTSFSGVYPSNQNQHLPGAASSYGSYPNDQPIFLPRDRAGYCGTYGAIPRGNVGPYSEAGGSYSRSNVEGNNNILLGAFPDPYRSGVNHPSPVANTRTVPFNYNVHGGPYPDIGGPQSNLLSSRMPTVSHTPPTTFYGTLAPYNGTPSSRPPLGNFPDNARLRRRSSVTATMASTKPEVPQCVVLNPADCDLDFNIKRDGLGGFPICRGGFAYCWSGARANVGITGGKYCFGCTVISEALLELLGIEQENVCGLGISRGDDIVGNLGVSDYSFGYGGRGKFSNGGKLLDYGQEFGIGDTVVCCVDLENKPLASIGFSKNGKWLDIATRFDAGPSGLGVVDSPPKDLAWESALFPHVLLKNVKVKMHFSIEDGLVPQEGFKPWATAIEDQNFILGPTCCDKRNCEVIVMVGLPASGKTTWTEKRVKEHPEKRYVLLGKNLFLDRIKVPGLLHENNDGRLHCLMDQASRMLNLMISRAAKTPRNYIIVDEKNLCRYRRRHRFVPFLDFWKIAVITFPKPEELKKRFEKIYKETGRITQPDALNSMLAKFVLPGSDESFDETLYVELNQDESCKYLEQMKQDFASLSNNNPLMLPHGVSRRSLAGPLQNQGSSLTGSGSDRKLFYGPIPRCNCRGILQFLCVSVMGGNLYQCRCLNGSRNVKVTSCCMAGERIDLKSFLDKLPTLTEGDDITFVLE